MKDEISPRSGILDCEQGSATFYEENYNFRIMNNHPVENASTESHFAIIKKEKSHYSGVTHDGKLIAIYIDSFSIPPIKTFFNLHANIYAIQENNVCFPDWNKIDAIRFMGGTINQLFHLDQPPYKIIGDAIKPASPKPAFPFIISYGGLNITVAIGQMITQYHSQTDVSISGRNGYIDLRFSSPISFSDIPFHTEKIKSLISFLTFRRNIDFDKIILQKKLPTADVLWDSASVYFKELSTPTQKTVDNNICFEELDVTVSTLIDLIYNENTNNPFTFMGFIPTTDKESGRTTNDMIKSIVTCLECEIARLRGNDVELIKPDSKSETYLAEEKMLNSLKKELHSTIKGFQKNHHRFSKKTSDMLKGTIDHMTLADADKIYLLYSNYQNLICTLFRHLDIKPTREDIERLIIYRNKTTHGTQEVLDERIVTTAIHLVGLIYCMILHSIGLDDNDIQMLCMKCFLS